MHHRGESECSHVNKQTLFRSIDTRPIGAHLCDSLLRIELEGFKAKSHQRELSPLRPDAKHAERLREGEVSRVAEAALAGLAHAQDLEVVAGLVGGGRGGRMHQGSQSEALNFATFKACWSANLSDSCRPKSRVKVSLGLETVLQKLTSIRNRN